jgi:uncharacterized membrane protein
MRQGKLHKAAVAAGFQLKGNGWYATDFKGGSKQQTCSQKRPTAPRLARAAREHALRARPADQTLLHYRTADLGAAGDHRLGAVADRQHADQSLRLLPKPSIRRRWSASIPGAGASLTLLIIFHRPARANFIGQRLVVWWEKLLARIPVVNSIYNSVKQVSDTLFSSNGNAFRKALLVQYPRQGSWTIAFLTGKPGGDVVNHLTGDYVSVYVPTTPNPTSGFFLMMPAKRSHRTRHDRRRSTQVHHLDGRRGPAEQTRALHPNT